MLRWTSGTSCCSWFWCWTCASCQRGAARWRWLPRTAGTWRWSSSWCCSLPPLQGTEKGQDMSKDSSTRTDSHVLSLTTARSYTVSVSTLCLSHFTDLYSTPCLWRNKKIAAGFMAPAKGQAMQSKNTWGCISSAGPTLTVPRSPGNICPCGCKQP